MSVALTGINALYINYLPNKYRTGMLVKMLNICCVLSMTENYLAETIVVGIRRAITGKPFTMKASLPCVKKVLRDHKDICLE